MSISPNSTAVWWRENVSDDVLAAIHDAAADLYEAAPWRHVPDKRCRLFVQPPELGPRIDVVAVTGQDGGLPGLRLFANLSSHLAWLDHDDERNVHDNALQPMHAALEFVPESDIADSVRATVDKNGWRIADANAWPVARLVRPDGSTDALNTGGIAMFEAVVRALIAALADPTPWQSAWHDGLEHEARVTVNTSQDGELDMLVTTTTPASMTLFEGTDSELLGAFELLDWSDGLDSVDHDRLAELERTLIARIRASEPDLVPLHQHAGIELLLDNCANIFGLPITQMSAADVESTLFESVPLVVAVPSSDAQIVVETLRRTLQWLCDRRPLTHADACFSLLDDPDTVKQTESLLRDEELFSPHKREFMKGLDAGFDMNTEEGYQAFLEQWRRDKLDSWMANDVAFSNQANEAGAAKALSPAQRKKRKNSRKAARKARKKNR